MATARTPAEPDWTEQVTELIVSTVDKIRDKTTGPVLKASRAVVYGFVAAMVGAAATALVVVSLVRVLAHFIPGPVWIVYAVAGSAFVLGGLFTWSKRVPRGL